MIATDAIAELTAHFRLDRVGTDVQDNTEYDFVGGFYFTATVIDDFHLSLSAPFDGLPQLLPPALARRLLEASVNGVETGPGQIGRHPTLGIALIEVIDCGPLTVEDFRLRMVDFMLYAEYWRSEGVDKLLAETAPLPTEAINFRL